MHSSASFYSRLKSWTEFPYHKNETPKNKKSKTGKYSFLNTESKSHKNSFFIRNKIRENVSCFFFLLLFFPFRNCEIHRIFSGMAHSMISFSIKPLRKSLAYIQLSKEKKNKNRRWKKTHSRWRGNWFVLRIQNLVYYYDKM